MVNQQICKEGQVRIFADRLVNPGSSERNVLISIEKNRIVEVGPAGGQTPRPGDVDARKYTIIPGLLDIHTHGSVGETFLSDCTPKSRRFLASRGTTAFLATTTTVGREEFLAGLKRLRQCISQQRPQDGAQMLGIRCESPFLEPSLGAQKGDLCWPVNNENIPLYMRFADENGYRTLIQPTHATLAEVFLNLTNQEPAWQEVVSDLRFRQALSMGIDRESIIS